MVFTLRVDGLTNQHKNARQEQEHHLKLTALTATVPALSACGGSGAPIEAYNLKPAYLGATVTASYDGSADDLLTAGLGKTGLGGAAPAVADPAKPTPAELRKLAIYNNYRAILDISAAGGYGTLYGPNVDAKGSSPPAKARLPVPSTSPIWTTAPASRASP